VVCVPDAGIVCSESDAHHTVATYYPRAASLHRLQPRYEPRFSAEQSPELLYRPAAKLDYEIANRVKEREAEYVRKMSEPKRGITISRNNELDSYAIAAQAELARRQKDPKWQAILPVAVGGSPLKAPESSPKISRVSQVPLKPIAAPLPVIYHPVLPVNRMYGIRHPTGVAVPGWYGAHSSEIEFATDLYLLQSHRGL